MQLGYGYGIGSAPARCARYLSPQQVARELTSPTKKWLLSIDGSTSREASSTPQVGQTWYNIAITGVGATLGMLSQTWQDGYASSISSHAPPTNAALTDAPLWFPFSSGVSVCNGAAIPDNSQGLPKRLSQPIGGFEINQLNMPALMPNLNAAPSVRLRGLAYAPAGENLADIDLGLFADPAYNGSLTAPGNVNHTVSGYGSLAPGSYLDASVELPDTYDYESLTNAYGYWFWIGQPNQATISGELINTAGPWLEADGPGVVVHILARSGTSFADGGHWMRTDIWPQSLHDALWPVLGSTCDGSVHLCCAGIPAETDWSEYATNLATWISRVRAADRQAHFVLGTAYDANTLDLGQHGYIYEASRTHGLLVVPTCESLPNYTQGRTRIVALAAAGYTDCVASDVGKTVTGGTTGDTGTLIRYDNTLRVWTILPDAIADEFDVTEALTIGSGTGAGTTTDVNVLTFGATYTPCVASDIGKTVTGGTTGDTGTLVHYLNVTRKWVVVPDDAGDLFDAAESVTLGSGTGAGTTTGASTIGASYGGVYSDTVHRNGTYGKLEYFTAIDQLVAAAAVNGNHACALTTDLSANPLTEGVSGTIGGIGLVIGAVVSVTVNGEAWGSTTVQSDGTWSITATPTYAMVGAYVDVVATIAGVYSCHPRWTTIAAA